MFTYKIYQIKNSEKPERKKKNPNSTTPNRIFSSFQPKKNQIQLEKNRQINASFRIFRARI